MAAYKKQCNPHVLHLVTTQMFQNTIKFIDYIYLDLTIIHPTQITNVQLKRTIDQNKQYQQIKLRLRSVSERNLLIWKIVDKSNINLRIDWNQHNKDLLTTLQKECVIINFASHARKLDINETGHRYTAPECVLSRWKGIGVLTTNNVGCYVSIEIPIEPYYNKTIPILHTLQLPYVYTLKLFREDIDCIIPTTNGKIRGYEINLNRIPIVEKLKLIRVKEKSNALAKSVCRWNDNYCPKQPKKACTYVHKAWLEADVDHGNDTNEWQSTHESIAVSAAQIFNAHQEFDLHSPDLKFNTSIVRLEFITMDPRSYQQLDDRLNKLMKGKIKDEVELCDIPTAFPNSISLQIGHDAYGSVYTYGQRNKDNIDIIEAYMHKWNQNKQHNVSFALKACIDNWPKIFIPEDINDVVLDVIDADLSVLNETQVIKTLLIISENKRFREQIHTNHTAHEIYLNAKDFHDDECNRNDEEMYALRCIQILPFHTQLSIRYITPKANIFSNNDEGFAYAKLSFVTQHQHPHYYTPFHFQANSDTLHQVHTLLSSGIIIANTIYQFMWYSDTDCKQATVTMIAPQLLPHFTLSGLRMKYGLHHMINQQSRMKHVAALETSATKMRHDVYFSCITEMKKHDELFDGCGIINKKWLRYIIKHNQLFGYKVKENKFADFASSRLEEKTKEELIEYLKYKGREIPMNQDKLRLINTIRGLPKQEQKMLKGEYQDEYYADNEDNNIIIQPIEVQIGDLQCILVPYEQYVIDEIMKQHATQHTNNRACVYLPENMYKELCEFEYQRNYKGTILFVDDDSDEDVPNAEPASESEEEEDPSKEDELIALLQARAEIPSYLLNEIKKTLKNAQQMKENNSSQLNDKHKDTEFTNDDIPEYSYRKLVPAQAQIPFYIHQDTKRCELLHTSKELINILEYHRKKQDEEMKSDDDKQQTVNILKEILVKMVEDNTRMMNNLHKTQEALRFLEIHDQMELYQVIKDKYGNKTLIPPKDVEFKRLTEISDKIWTKCCQSLEIPFITEPYLSRKMMAICDHTGNLPKGKVFLQLKVQQSSSKICNICAHEIAPNSQICTHRDGCHQFVEQYRPLHERVIIMQSAALSPQSLHVFDAISDPKLAKLFPNQNILIFSSKDINIVSSLSSTSNVAQDTSYLDEYGRCKLFDCIIIPQFYYLSHKSEHMLLKSSDVRHSDAWDNSGTYPYLWNFTRAFFPFANIRCSGFDQPLYLQAPKQQNNDNNEMKYEQEEDQDEDKDKDPLWTRESSWLWPQDKDISDMRLYIDYFIKVNQNNYALLFKERFEIETQLNMKGMDSNNCRDFMRLYAHYTRLMESNYSVNVNCAKLCEINKYPLYMLDKPLLKRKHIATVCGHIFDEILNALPHKLHHLVDTSLITDPQRDYNQDVMNPQAEIWRKDEHEKRFYNLQCKHCDKTFRHWRERKDHLDTQEHKQRMEQLRKTAADENVHKYITETGAVKGTAEAQEIEEKQIRDDEEDEMHQDAYDNHKVERVDECVDEFVIDIQNYLEMFTKKISKRINEQRERLLQEPPQIVYQAFKEWNSTLNESRQLLNGYENQLNPELLKELHNWKRYLNEQQYRYKKICKEQRSA